VGDFINERVACEEFGRPEKALKLRISDLPVPIPGPGQVAIENPLYSMKETMTHPNILPNTTSISDPVAAAQALTQLIEDNREALTKGPDLSPALADVLIQAGLMQLWVPRALGGPETGPLEFVRAIEAGQLDGAVAWCAMISSATSRMSGLIAAEPMRRLMPFGTMYAFSGGGHYVESFIFFEKESLSKAAAVQTNGGYGSVNLTRSMHGADSYRYRRQDVYRRMLYLFRNSFGRQHRTFTAQRTVLLNRLYRVKAKKMQESSSDTIRWRRCQGCYAACCKARSVINFSRKDRRLCSAVASRQVSV
jgi:hypothetical protein